MMRIEDLSPDQLLKLQKAKAEVIRHGLLHRSCTDQRFLGAVAVKKRNPRVYDSLRGALDEGGRIASALRVMSELADELSRDEGVWDADGWRAS